MAVRSVDSAAYDPPSAAPRAPAPRSKNSPDAPPYAVLSTLPPTCCAVTVTGTAITIATAIALSRRARNLVMAISSRREVDDGEPADLRLPVRRLNVIEVHAGGDELIIAVAEVPGQLATATHVILRQDPYQYAIHRVNAHDRLHRDIHELQHLCVLREFKRVGDVVWIRYRMHLVEHRIGVRHE